MARRQAGCQSGRVCNFGLKSDTREMRGGLRMQGFWSQLLHQPPPARNDSYTPQHLSWSGYFGLFSAKRTRDTAFQGQCNDGSLYLSEGKLAKTVFDPQIMTHFESKTTF